MKGAYLGIVKKVTETMVGVDMQIITKFANDEETLEGWMRLYPEQEGIILNNNELLEIIKNKIKTGFNETEIKNPKTYHAIAAPYIAKIEFEIEDSEGRLSLK